MDLNTIFLGLFGLLGVYASYVIWKAPKPVKIVSSLPVPQQVGRSKQIQSKTGDASLTTELIRRRTIQTSGRDPNHTTKETFVSKGSTTGAIETFFLSAICPRQTYLQNAWYDGGIPTDEFCPILNGSDTGLWLDGGNQNTTVCLV